MQQGALQLLVLTKSETEYDDLPRQLYLMRQGHMLSEERLDYPGFGLYRVILKRSNAEVWR